MQKAKTNLAVLALLISVILNCVGLVLMRILSNKIDTITSLLIGYLLTSVPLFWPNLSGRPILPPVKKESLTIIVWGLSLFGIYFLFLGFPELVSPSQVILGLTLAPLIATFVTGDLRLKEAFNLHKLKLAPILLLLILGISEARDRSQLSIWTFLLILLLFSASQTSARRLSRIDRPFYAQSRMATVVAISLCLWYLCRSHVDLTLMSIGFGLFFGLLLTAVFRLTLFGIRNTTPIGSSLLLSLSVPISLIAETLLLGRKLMEFQVILTVFYMMSVGFIQIRTQRNKQA